jgi:hypothetical protein
VGKTRHCIIGHADPIQKILDGNSAIRDRADFVNLVRLFKNIPDGLPRIERFKGILKNDLHVFADPAQPPLRDRHQVLPHKMDGAAVRLDQAKNGPSQRCFSATRFSDQPKGFSLLDRQRNIIYSIDIPSFFPEYTAI